MSRREETEITRYLGGEASPEEGRAFEARLAAEPALGRALERRRRLWESLELPPAAPAPPGFAARVAARARAVEPGAALPPLPAWARAAAAAALVAGCLAGVGVGALVAAPSGAASASGTGSSAAVWDEEEPLAATYLAATASEEPATPSGEEGAR